MAFCLNAKSLWFEDVTARITQFAYDTEDVLKKIGERMGASPANNDWNGPNFFIVGASKSGTTSLYAYLSQHPDIFMSTHKEPEYFIAPDGDVLNVNGLRGWHINTNRINNLSSYQRLFAAVSSEKAIGEASANYLYIPGTAERIKASILKPTILVLLRNPVERAYSAYLHHVRDGLEDRDFASALEDERRRIAAGWGTLYHYQAKGYYYQQLSRFYKAFGKDRVHVFLYEELKSNPIALSQKIFRLLGVDDSFKPITQRTHNPSGMPKSALLQGVYRFLIGYNTNTLKNLGKQLLPVSLRRNLKDKTMQRIEKVNLHKPAMSAELWNKLTANYREETLCLQTLIGRDLTSWLETKRV